MENDQAMLTKNISKMANNWFYDAHRSKLGDIYEGCFIFHFITFGGRSAHELCIIKCGEHF